MSGNNLSIKYSVLEKVVELTHQVFFIYDPEKNYLIHINKAYEQIWERSAKELATNMESVISTIHPEDLDYIQENYDKLFNELVVKNVEFRIFLPDKAIKWVCLTAYIIEEEGKKVIAGIVEDISGMKEYHFNILKFNAKKNSILEILSHDLSAPFATIQGMVSLLHKKVEYNADENTLEVLNIIQETCKRGRNLIRDFVDNEFLESSQIIVNKERIDIVRRLQQAMEEYKRSEQFIAKHFELITQKEPIYVELDEMKFMQVINNLISNAIKFTEDDGRISVIVVDNGNSVLFTIRDNGIGIPEEMHSYLFDKFTKARRPGIRGEQSTGLGMSIIKKIVELHGGKIWFESKENKGSSFFIEIPKND